MNAIEIDKSIRENIMGMRPSILAMSLDLEKIKSGNLYKDLGCDSMAKYIRRLCDEIKINRSSIYKWLYIGEMYVKHRDDLEKAGFSDSDGPSKLVYLERALETRETREVFGKIKDLSVRDFIEFVKNTQETGAENPAAPLWDNGIFADGMPAVSFNRALDRRVYIYFRKVIREAVKALEEEEIIVPVRLKNWSEVRSYHRISARVIAKMRKRMTKRIV